MLCLVFTDTVLHSLTKGKSYLTKQKWRRSTCLRDQRYDVGCHPCLSRQEEHKLGPIGLWAYAISTKVS